MNILIIVDSVIIGLIALYVVVVIVVLFIGVHV